MVSARRTFRTIGQGLSSKTDLCGSIAKIDFGLHKSESPKASSLTVQRYRYVPTPSILSPFRTRSTRSCPRNKR